MVQCRCRISEGKRSGSTNPVDRMSLVMVTSQESPEEKRKDPGDLKEDGATNSPAKGVAEKR